MEWTDKVRGKKNIIFVGESGCGKTELSMNCAVELVHKVCGEKVVNLVDMDQTKGTFRSRDHEKTLRAEKVSLICGEHFLDTPVVPHGVLRLIKGEEFVNVFDIGGNEIGAITMGQFAEEIKKTKSVVFFIINPFRLLSMNEGHIKTMIDKIKDYGDFENFEFIANPNMGEYTDADTVSEGMETLNSLADKLGIKFTMVTFPHWLKGKTSQKDVIYIKRYLEYP